MSGLKPEPPNNDPVTNDSAADDRSTAGLCADCRHVRRIASDRASIFYMCGLSATNARFPKYPRLPVLSCEGYEKPDEPHDEPHDDSAPR